MSSEFCLPAAYGQACAGCVSGKCKCMLRQDGDGCERCHRLGKQCEPSPAARKRKSPSPPPDAPDARRPRLDEPSAAGAGHVSLSGSEENTARLEKKIDELLSLVRAQAASGPRQTTRVDNEDGAPSPKGPATSSAATADARADSGFPDIVMDPATASIQLVRRAAGGDPAVNGSIGSSLSTSADPEMSPVAKDIESARRLWGSDEEREDEQLEIFRDEFIPAFPFVRLDIDLSADELFEDRPFLWLVIMALTEKSMERQFAMEEAIWDIISRRIVAEQLADLDLLLGLICFTNWSNVFKKDKPFASMTSQLAVTMARELELHKEAPTLKSYRAKGGRLVPQLYPEARKRTLEERRTMLAVFQVSSGVWACFRKFEPLAWTPYLESCLEALKREKGTIRDCILIIQVKCQLILNHLSCPSPDDAGADGPGRCSKFLAKTLLSQLDGIRRSVPWPAKGRRSTKMYLWHTELAIRGLCLDRQDGHDVTWKSSGNRVVPRRIRWAQELEKTLTACEQWVSAFQDRLYPVELMAHTDLNYYVQMTHCFVQLFRIHTLPDGENDGKGNGEPGWDFEDIRRRADVFKVLDAFHEAISEVPESYEMVDAPGTRSGFFFKAPRHLRMIKEMMLSELPEDARLRHQKDKAAQEKVHTQTPPPPPQQQQQQQQQRLPESAELSGLQASEAGAAELGSADPSSDRGLLDDEILNEATEPWIMDFLGCQWDIDSQPQGLYYVPDSDGY